MGLWAVGLIAAGFEDPITVHISKTASLYNYSWVQGKCSVGLHELQTHSWDSSSDTIIFLYPWSKGKFSNKELSELETYFRNYFTSVSQAVHTGLLQLDLKPEAWVSSGPSPGPGHLLLVRHVSGFYPKPVWVMWIRGEQEQLGTQRGDILPNGDGTWHVRATLDVAAEEAAGLACRVKHSSLGGQDLVLHWGGKSGTQAGDGRL
uniref:T-cell surface glycoprotein CD1a-like n=1 Tax=Urocitellus parryii TaxID=9999 RepID=UPI000E55C816|nr:T-cell surface glycoprotein CD1a-like [Urocitellus parryii]